MIKTMESWVEGRGWKKVKGVKVNLQELRDCNDEWDYFYLNKDDVSDYIEEVEFWQSNGSETECFEDVEQVIEFIEENSEDRYEEEEDDGNKNNKGY